jgi:lipoprotein-anchoring transpeptidase ErfK/SrfK
MKPFRFIKIASVAAVGLFLIMEVAGYVLEALVWSKDSPVAVETDGGPARKPPTDAELKTRNARLEGRIAGLAPRGVYVVVDTAANRLYVMKSGKVVREAVVSCGSGDILEDPEGKREWIFDTPRGEFSVTSKLINPTWIKPDWAFIEEGEKPPTDYNERIDNDTLGDYALGFGSGYFIHGTLYTRLLGRNVTHGCVRVGDKDLEEVFKTVPMGAKIFIY